MFEITGEEHYQQLWDAYRSGVAPWTNHLDVMESMAAWAAAHGGYYSRVRTGCCASCVWAALTTGASNDPFDEAMVVRPTAVLAIGDGIKSFVPILALGRCALGEVTGLRRVGRRTVATVRWEDRALEEDAPGVGSSGFLTLRREGEPRGQAGEAGLVELRPVPRPWEAEARN